MSISEFVSVLSPVMDFINKLLSFKVFGFPVISYVIVFALIMLIIQLARLGD